MGFVDYLAFIQVSIAFNFASAYWKEHNEDDAIRNLFRQLHDWDKIEAESEVIKKEIGIVEAYRPALSERKHEELEDEKIAAYYGLKQEWDIVNQKILNLYSSLMSKDRYTYFNDVCILLALYGFIQLFMLPDVYKEGHEMFRNSYVFITEILMITLLLLLVVEMIQKMECISKFLKIDYIVRIPRVFSVFVFLFIVFLGIGFSFTLEYQWRDPWVGDFCEKDLVYASIFLPYASFIIYFLLVFIEFVYECWCLKITIPDRKRERSLLLWKMKKTVNR